MRLRARRRLAVVLVSAFCILTEASACTIGVFGPSSNTLGRPILWKNRDVNNENQAVAYFDGPRFRFVTNVYAGETTDAWAGINEAGFAIMNSNSYNLGGKDRDGADDGSIMMEALGTCATVDDFSRLLDSLNVVGRETPANFGVFDSTGMTAIFEASNTFYTRFNAQDDTMGFILRANYSMSGSPSRLTGHSRYERAMKLVVPAWQERRIDMPFLVRDLSRDMGQTFFDPYPFPFEGQVESLPYGYVPTDSTICRYKTRSVEFVVGPRPGEPAANGMMWTMLGTPETALPLPAWAQGGPAPWPAGGPGNSLICDEAMRVRAFTRPDPEHVEEVNTLHCREVYSAFAPVESALFGLVDSAEATWSASGPTPGQAYDVTSRACDVILQAYVGFWSRHDTREPLPLPDSEPRVWQDVLQGDVVVRLPHAVGEGVVRMFDAAGRRVAALAVPPGRLTFRLPLAGMRSGSYFLVFPKESGLRPARFVYVR
jgi:hypothetical protein